MVAMGMVAMGMVAIHMVGMGMVGMGMVVYLDYMGVIVLLYFGKEHIHDKEKSRYRV